MAIVINVPKDTRAGTAGRGLGQIASALFKARGTGKDAEVIADVAAGRKTYAEGITATGGRGVNELRTAEASYNQANPQQTYLKVEGGKATRAVTSRKRPEEEGFVREEVAAFNVKGKGTDTARGIAEVRTNQVDISDVFEGKTDAQKNQASRNIYTEPNMVTKLKDSLAQDKFGTMTGDSQFIFVRAKDLYGNMIRGIEGETLNLDRASALRTAERRARKELKGFRSAELESPGLTPTEYFYPNGAAPEVAPEVEQAPEPVGLEDTFKPAGDVRMPAIQDDPLQWLRSNIPGLIQQDTAGGGFVPDALQDPEAVAAPAELAPVEARIQDSTDAAVNVQYPVQPDEEWVDVGEQFPLVPQSMMDLTRGGDVVTAAALYSSMAGIPVPLAQQLLQQNANKMPVKSNVRTVVVPDPVSDTPEGVVLPPEVAAAPAVERPQVDSNIRVPGVAPLRRFQNPGDLAPNLNNTIVK